MFYLCATEPSFILFVSSGIAANLGDCHFAECSYAECHYTECRYADCRGT
jgi:hypothetical protein